VLTEFASLLFSRQELKEVYESLVMRALVEDDLRQEEGLEQVDRRPLVEKIGQLLAMSGERLEILEDRLDQELWHHDWYAYTDEWAWYRARKEVLAELGASASGMKNEAIDDIVHRRYHEKFEEYVREIDMDSGGGGTERKSKQRKT
jgi:hypothetical protein